MAKNIYEIDKNLVQQSELPEGTKVYDVLNPPFKVYGLHKPTETGLFSRGAQELKGDERINSGVHSLITNTTGGRVRFATNSKTIAICVKLPNRTVFSHMTQTGVCGFDMYAECDGGNRHVKSFIPPYDVSLLEYTVAHTFEEKKMRELTIHFPLYNDVEKLYIALDEGAELKEAKPYKNEKPIFFYGASSEQGCSASRPGMCHTNILSRWLDSDTVNFAFSGSDKGEPALAEYIAKQPMSVFVHCYGPNSPSLPYYADTYYPFYKIIREKNPDLPIIFMANLVALGAKNPTYATKIIKRREVVMKAYLKAKSEGDKNVYWIDGFYARGYEAEEGTVDGGHATDLSYNNMAKSMYPLLRKLIYKD